MIRYIVSALALSVASTASHAASYTFKNIADSTGPFGSFGFFVSTDGPSINDAGVVAFKAELDGGGERIFTGNGGPTTTIVSGGFPSRPSINNAGTVAFRSGDGIFTGRGGPTTTIALRGDRFSYLGVPSINDSGVVAFSAELSAGGKGIFTGNGGPTTTIADSSGPLDNFGRDAPSINAAGTVAFVASLDAGGPSETGIFIGSGGPITTIAIGSAPTFGGAHPAINDAGAVAFYEGRYFVDPNTIRLVSQVISTGSGGPITTIADSSGPFDFPGFGEPDINDAGTVAFLAPLDTGGKGIFTGDDPLADNVIATGDPLFGSTVADLNFFRGLNDRGDIAFHYELANGSSGIAVAVVPEPASAVILVLGAIGMLTWTHSRRNGVEIDATVISTLVPSH